MDDQPTNAANAQPSQPKTDDEPVISSQTEATAALETIRKNMRQVATEFSQGKISRAQFNAIYTHYSEKRAIVEKLVERNPETDAWKAAAASGATTFLRDHYAAKPIYYLVFSYEGRQPLARGGKQPPDSARYIFALLKTIWSKNTQEPGVARKELDNGLWSVIALGDNAFTVVLFVLQPSIVQINLVRDLHNDFERANELALQRHLPADRMVFPQRSLIEEN